MKRLKHHSCIVRVAWQKKPVAYLTPADFDDYLYFAKRYGTINSFLKAQVELGIFVSKEVMMTYKKLVMEGAGDIPFRQWRIWSEKLEEQRKKAKSLLKPEKEPVAEEWKSPYEGKGTNGKLDLGFRVYRLVDENGISEADPCKIIEQERESVRQFEEMSPRMLSEKERRYLLDCALRLKFDKEYRTEFENESGIKVVNID